MTRSGSTPVLKQRQTGMMNMTKKRWQAFDKPDGIGREKWINQSKSMQKYRTQTKIQENGEPSIRF